MPGFQVRPILLIKKPLLLFATIFIYECSGYTSSELLDAKFLTQAVPYLDSVLASEYNTLLISYNEKIETASGQNTPSIKTTAYRVRCVFSGG